MDDDEEILINLAEVLGGFTDKVGGPQHAPHLLKPLETLCGVEESVVRDKATEGIKKILQLTKIRDIEGDLMAMIKRLMNGENFTSKFAATYLIPTLYPHVSSGS